MLNGLLRIARTLAGLMWVHIGPFVLTLFGEESPWVTVLISPHVDWEQLKDCKNLISRWEAAVSVIPYTEEVGQSVVDTLLHVASIRSLRPHISIDVWAWLEKQPSLPSGCLGRSMGAKGSVVRHIRALGDIGILKSYFLLVWSEWIPIWDRSEILAEMRVSIREDFSGLGRGRHREDLIKRLDHVLEQLEYRIQRGLSYDEQGIRRTKKGYTNLKGVLLEVDRKAMKILTRMPLRIITPSIC
jgi:hypothetical protein